jgi:hypothetical protein
MVVGGFTLDLYCDFPSVDAKHEWEHMGSAQYPGPGVQQFVHAENGAGARAAARRAGWRIERGGMRALCPWCIQRGRILPPLNP